MSEIGKSRNLTMSREVLSLKKYQLYKYKSWFIFMCLHFYLKSSKFISIETPKFWIVCNRKADIIEIIYSFPISNYENIISHFCVEVCAWYLSFCLLSYIKETRSEILSSITRENSNMDSECEHECKTKNWEMIQESFFLITLEEVFHRVIFMIYNFIVNKTKKMQVLE